MADNPGIWVKLLMVWVNGQNNCQLSIVNENGRYPLFLACEMADNLGMWVKLWEVWGKRPE